MTSYTDLLKQREALDKQIAEARKRDINEAVTRVRALVAEFGLSAEDIFPSGKAGRSGTTKKGSKVAPKYRDPATGSTWTGRGKAPKWIEGQDRVKFAIA